MHRAHDFFGSHPLNFIDDIIEAVRDFVGDQVDELEAEMNAYPVFEGKKAEIKQVRSGGCSAPEKRVVGRRLSYPLLNRSLLIQARSWWLIFLLRYTLAD